MSDRIQIKYEIKTDKVGSECSDVVEFERSYWESLTEEQREEEMKECAFEHIEWHFEEHNK